MASWSSERGRCRQFTLPEIKKATRSFSDENFLGEGGEGIVYKGFILDARKNTIHIAVKRLSRLRPGERALKSFEKEIKLLSKFHHANLVSLIGYCRESDEKILVYELMSKENLREKLKNTTSPLSYEERVIICIGAARGIDYLHTGTSLDSKIIHGDIKPDNILLTEKMEAKVSDFGLSRIVAANQTRSSVITLHLCGTPGYFAPEFVRTGNITWRVDVYSFGVVLVEVLCKKKPPRDDSKFNDKDDGSFRKWAISNVDPVLKRAISESSLEVFISTAEKCLNEDPDKRPRMNEVVGMLDYALKLQKNGVSDVDSAVNGEKRRVDSETNSSKSSYGFRTSKSAKLEKTSSSDWFSESSTSSWMSESTWPESDGEIVNSSQESRLSFKSWEKSEEGDGISSKKDAASTSSLILPDIPGTEDKVVLYYGMSGAVTDYMTALLYLNKFEVDIEQRDPTQNKEFETELTQFLSQKQKEFSLPQLFIGGKHIGGAKEVVQLHDSGELGQYLAVYQH